MNTPNHSRKLAAVRRADCYLILLAGLLAMNATQAADLAASNAPSVIPWNEIGAKAGADYQGDGLAVTPDGTGAHLHCVFQRLDGEATPEGLWLTSTVTNTISDRFRVTAMVVDRTAGNGTYNSQFPESNIPLPGAGEVSVCGQTVRLSRPGLTEEYSVSMDGVRQDFIVEQVPPSPPGGELVVKLAVSGAQVEPAADGARLVLDNSGRKIAYSRLRVTDATGKELPARIEVAGRARSPLPAAMGGDTDNGAHGVTRPTMLVVVVNDAEAVYPVRIDPTFSDANWVSMGGLPGANGSVDAAVTDGSGNLYIGGAFTEVGNIIANNIAQWNGSSWSPLGSGAYGDVLALAVSGGTLYAGGDGYFTTAGGTNANYIAQWNGSSWSALGSGLGPESVIVNALAVSGSTLYVGGYFTTAGGDTNANYIAQWNGSSWSPLGSGMNDEVGALAVSGSTLYAGGYFTTAGGSAANYIAQWNGTTWSPLGSGMSGGEYATLVDALAVSGGALYAGGQFSTAGGNAANSIAQWNGTSWSALGSGMNSQVYALAVSGGALYAGGQFSTAGGNAANSIAQWNGSSWSALGSGLGPESVIVYALAVSGGTLYVGGQFAAADGSAADAIAQWNGSSWSALDSGLSGLNGEVLALVVSGGTLYAGGEFTMAGGDTNANCVAQWNGSSWSALGSGMSGGDGDGPSVGDGDGPYVSALAVSGGTLYAGGDFTTAGGSAANFIAQWNGTNWSALGSGMTYGDVFALAVSGGTLYAGGDFSAAGGDTNANNIAQWNGSSWSPLGSALNGGDVLALAVSGSTLYAGGDFGIVQWNGNSWSALGSGVSNGFNQSAVWALAVSGGTLYAGGYFSAAGGNAANNIAQWNGTSWSPLGSGMSVGDIFHPNRVSALAVSGGTLFAGGDFTTAGGSAANCIAQWNGSSWSALGSGVSNGFNQSAVWALAVSGGTLYAGGSFTTAGTNVSAYAAMAYLPVPPTLSLIADGTNMVLTWPDAATGYTTGYTLEFATNLVPPVAWQTNDTPPVVINGLNFVTNSIIGTQQYFRLLNP